MNFEELAARIVRNNATARSLANQWSGRMLSALTSDSADLLSEIMNEFNRTTQGSAPEALGPTGPNDTVDNAGGV